MRAAAILGVDALRFIEPSFDALTDSAWTDLLVRGESDEGRFLLDEDQDLIGAAFHGPDGWVAASFLCRKPSVAIIERFEEVPGEIVQEERAAWAAAVREYFSREILQEVQPAIEDLNPLRRALLSGVITRAWGTGAGDPCLDSCCGSGIGSVVLRDLGYAPLSFDHDAGLLARGLAEHRLRPEETMLLDATRASAYIDPVPRGIGIMFGDINSLNQEMWEQIVGDLLALTDETLITVGTEREADLIREWGTAAGRIVEVRESSADPIYDRWICIARKN